MVVNRSASYLRVCRRNALVHSLVLTVAGVLFFATATSAEGAVPPALRQRTQEPAVETVIKALEDKAAAAGDGTWASDGGWQDVPATEWVTGIQGNQWYWRAPQGSRYESDTVFSDGELFYELPRRQWFGLDVAERGQRLEYRQGYYLLHVNLRPRQFLGAAAGLTALGEKQLDGVAYLHLQAHPQRDQSAAADPYLQRGQSRVVLDLYYDSARKAVARSVTTDVNARYECVVTAWENFGKAGQWPKRIESRQFLNDAPSGAQPRVHLITIDSFAAGADPQVAAVAQSVAVVPFFGSDARHLRQPTTYSALVAAQPENRTLKVALAEATLRAGDPGGGLSQWDALTQDLPENERQRLTTVLAPSAAWSLQRGYKTQPDASTAIIVRLAGLPAEPQGPELPFEPVWRAWKSLRRLSSVAEQIAAVEPTLLQRMARFGNPAVLVGLMRMAAANADDAAKINPVLDQVAAAQLPPEGYGQSQLAVLVSAAIEAKQWDRAERYLAAVAWHPDTPAEAKAPVAVLRTLLGERARAETGAVESLPVLIESYRQASAAGFPSDRYARGTVQEVSASFGAGIARAAEDVGAVVGVTAGNMHAPAFWDGVISHLLDTRVRGGAATAKLVATAEQLGQAIEQRLGVAGKGAQVLLRIGASDSLTGASTQSSSVRIEYFNRAFAAAPDDSLRLQSLRAIAKTYGEDGEFDQAVQAVEGLAAALTSADAKAAAAALVTELNRDKAATEAKAEELAQQVEADRLKGQLKHLEQRLAEATERERPADEIAAIQQVIDQTRQELESDAGGTATE